jgi:coenzyme F420 biosynthesis associated uncharacterized protein
VSEPGEQRVPEPVDWPTARRVARAVAGRDPLSTSYLGTSLEADFVAATGLAERLVADLTGLHAPGPARAAVLDRREWVEANLDSMRRLLGPLTERLGARMARSALAPVGRFVAGTEMGVLLGYLAQRVLGQYDLLVPDEAGAEGDAVFYVGPNVLALEKRFAFRPRDFRLWIAIHEVTHRAQFTGVPWMRGHFLGLVEQAFGVVDADPRTVVRALRRAIDEMRAGRNPLDDGGLMALFASAEQRDVLDRVQALMSVLEGHGNYVMSELGHRHVAGEERMARVLEHRRHAGGLTAQVHKLLGFEQKMRQYEVGERFVRATVADAGPVAVDWLWRSADDLPTIAELHDPGAWVARMRDARPAAR